MSLKLTGGGRQFRQNPKEQQLFFVTPSLEVEELNIPIPDDQIWVLRICMCCVVQEVVIKNFLTLYNFVHKNH